MRYLFKLLKLNSCSCNNLLKFHCSDFQTSNFSKLYRLHNASKDQAPQMKKQGANHNLGSLFNEIIGILETENVKSDQNQAGSSEFDETQLINAELRVDFDRLQGVCLNAGKRIENEKGNFSSPEGNHEEVSDEFDVSPIVHKITEIVRGENGGNAMEVMLERADFEYTLEIVEKVLKRCFKVPHLALRFFNWMKLKEGFSHSTETYNTMIYIAGEAKKFGVVEELLEEIDRNSIEKNIKTWTILVAQYGKGKFISKALLTFEEMKKSGVEPDVKVYDIMLRSLANARKADIALEFYKEMVQKNMDVSVNLYQQLLKCFAWSGDVAAVYSLGDDMITVSKIPESLVYDFMLKSLCIAGRIREALELIHNMKVKNVQMDSNSFETLVEGLCRAGRISDALEIVDILKKKNIVDGKIYCIIVNGYLRRNDVSKAFDTLQITKDSGYIPSVSTYTNLIQRLIWMNEFEKALELYNEMIASGVKLDSVAVTAIVVGFIRQNCFSEAWRILKGAEEIGVKATQKSYTVLIKELCKVSGTDEIVKVLNEMKASNLSIGEDALRLVVPYMERKGEMQKVEKILQMQGTCKDSPKEDDSKPSLQLISEQIKEGSLDNNPKETRYRCYTEEDLHMVSRILSSSTDWYLIQEKLEKCAVQFTPDLVADILCKSNMHSGAALQFFSWVGKQAGYRHSTESYNIAIKISGRGKDFKHMRSLFHEMRRNGYLITSDTWTIMIMQYGRTGLTDIALGTFREMKASGCKPNASTYKFLIISLCGRKGRKVDEAIKIFREMIDSGFIPDKELLESYLGSLCEVGKLPEARSCSESLSKIGFTYPLTCSLYIRALCRAGRLEEAREMIDKSGPENHTLKQYTCGSLIHGLLRKGRIEEAFAEMESIKNIGISPSVHIYTSLISHFFKEKQVCKALEIFKNMKEEGCEPTVVTYSAIIHGYIDMGKATEAWEVFDSMRRDGPLPDFKTYSMFITGLCKTGNSEKALRLVYEMLDDGIIPSTVNFRTVFYGLNREGKQQLAQTVLSKKWELNNRRKFQI